MSTIPVATAWLIGDLGIAPGKQALFTHQSPQRLKVLREHALIQSAVSSNRIEGVEVDDKRISTLVFGSPSLRDRDEEEVRGYRSGLDLIHGQANHLPLSDAIIRQLHRLARGEIWDAGHYKTQAEPIVELSADGKRRVRFMPVEAGAPTEAAMEEMISLSTALDRDGTINPLVLMAATVLDFLCIHPFRDGNGRVSRLLMLLLCYHGSAEVGRYVSLERLMEQNKDRYYETPEIVEYELRRELLRLNKTTAVNALEIFIAADPDRMLRLNSAALKLAAELWAVARMQGTPTADPHALDVDVILCAQVLTANFRQVVPRE